MTTSTEQKIQSLVTPLIQSKGAFIYDVEFASGVLKVTVDRDGGIDVDAVGELSRSISDLLDKDESVVPADSYLLEVTSPGIERKLRKAEHFQAMVGETVKVKLRHGSGAARRAEGKIISAGEVDFVLFDQESNEERVISYADVDSARSVYDFTTALESAKKSSAPTDEPTNDDDEKATAKR